MGREIRRVHKDWQHPKEDDPNDRRGAGLKPLHSSFPYNKEEIEEGLRDGWLVDEPPNYGIGVMPQWSEERRTHYQMYECTTEGTPISPVFATPEEVAHWCADNGASAFADETATYKQWLAVASGLPAPSAVLVEGRGLVSGVEHQTDDPTDP